MRINLDHVHIFSSTLSTTLAFFEEMLGATIVWEEEAAGVRNVRLRLGNAFIHVYDQAPKAKRGGAVHHIGIETDDLDGLVASMRAKGHDFRNEVREQAKFRYVMTAGPDDLLIELYECLEPTRWQIPT
jgi:catechol 2,3-dioxygenase-like lactoylglutathione lyase family enzyme